MYKRQGTDSASRIDEESLIRLHGKEAICASDEADCRVRPLAKEYIRSVNKAMRGGRCEGFALLSGLLYAGDIDAADFGAATAAEMSLEDNDALGAEIAYWFATQYLQDVVMETTQALTAEEAVRFLSDEFSKEDHGLSLIHI